MKLNLLAGNLKICWNLNKKNLKKVLKINNKKKIKKINKQKKKIKKLKINKKN